MRTKLQAATTLGGRFDECCVTEIVNGIETVCAAMDWRVFIECRAVVVAARIRNAI